MKARNGQIALFLLFVLVVIVLLTLLNVDTFLSVRAKNRVQNAGDAAALAASRKQGALINEIGRLNVEHLRLVTTVTNEMSEAEVRRLRERIERETVHQQRRLALLGPVDALRLANEAAKRNGMEVRDEFARILREHVRDIRTVYAGGGQAGDPYPEPYPGAWTEYASRIESVIGEGLATGPDNIEFYDGVGGHMLLNRAFYMAISGREWCWFHFNARNLLEEYDNYTSWAPLPDRRKNAMDNSEIFSLHVTTRKCPITEVFRPEEIVRILERYSDEPVSRVDVENSLLADPEQVWFFFEDSRWHTWFNGLALADDEEGYEFPIAGEIKPEYNIRGCAAVCRCQKRVDAVAIESTSDFTWSAAAKPFGTVEDLDGNVGVVNGLRKFVVPCLTDVRLVPLDAVGGQELGTADYGWVSHIRHHLGAYLEHGPRNAQGCFYCLQLQAWERDSFRRSGVNWLKYHSSECRRSYGGSGGGHGGTSHGH